MWPILVSSSVYLEWCEFTTENSLFFTKIDVYANNMSLFDDPFLEHLQLLLFTAQDKH